MTVAEVLVPDSRARSRQSGRLGRGQKPLSVLPVVECGTPEGGAEYLGLTVGTFSLQADR